MLLIEGPLLYVLLGSRKEQHHTSDELRVGCSKKLRCLEACGAS